MTIPRFLKWLFSWRTARRALITLAILITLAALFYTEENIRGKHAWDTYRRQLEAQGEQLDYRTLIPKAIPDEENFAATPFIKSWFVRSNNVSRDIWKGDYYERARDHIVASEAKQDTSTRHFLDLPAWSRAFEAVRARKMTDSQNFASNTLDAESRAKTAPSVLEGLKTNEEVFAELRAADQRPLSRYPINYDVENLAEILLPHLNKIRGACRRLQLKACAELVTGRSDLALEDMKLIFRLVDSLKEEPFVISYLVRLACVQMAIQPIWEGLAEHAWSDAQLEELQAHLQSYNFVADLGLPLAGELAGGIAVIDFSRKHGVGRLIDLLGPGQPTSLNKDVADFFGRIIPLGWWYQEQLNYCRLFGVQFTGTYDGASRRVNLGRIESNVHQFNQASAVQNPWRILSAVFPHHQLMSVILLPALPEVLVKAAIAQTATDQAVIACALERYRLAKGQFPDTLSALTPQFISQLPHDVITGDPYQYQHTADGQFVLNSVGWNEKNQGNVSGSNDNVLGTVIKNLFKGTENDWVWQYPLP